MAYERCRMSLGFASPEHGGAETPPIINQVPSDTVVLPPPQPAYGTAPPGTLPTTAAASSGTIFGLPTKTVIIGAVALGAAFLLLRKK
jgi:hypothetical protein